MIDIPKTGVWFIHDFETQNNEYYGSLASPHHPDNYPVATGWAVDNQPIQHMYFNNPDEARNDSWLDELQNCQVYVAHNATFEIQWMMKWYREKFLAFLKQGGRIFCTQYAEFLLSNQTELYPSLEETAAKYGGTKKIDEVKILWESGVLTADIDQALLVKYLADPVVGDIANTRLSLFAQVTELKRRGMYDMFKMRMDSLLFNAISSNFGLHVDMQVAAKNQAESEAQIATLQEGIMALLPKDLPPELEFSFTSGFHKSAFMFGGAVKYDKKVSYDPVKYVKQDTYHFKNGDVMSQSEWWSLTPECREEFQASGNAGDIIVYASGKNKGNPKEFKDDTSEELLKWGDGTYTFKGLINLNDLPEHVSEQYLGKRAEFKGKQKLADDTPVYSTGKDSLDVLANFSDAAKPIKDLATLEKDVGTYYLRTDPKTGKQSGMLQYVEPDGIIHHQLNNCATVTGRLSSSKPNLQNVPRDGTSKVKEMFTSRFGEAGRIVEVDYSALEVVALAAISGDSNLMRMLIEGIDMHCYRLAAKLGEPYETVKDLCTNPANLEHKQYKQMRTDIKPRAFAHQYGASAAGISYSTGCSLSEAEEFKQIEFKLFPESNAYPANVVRPMVEATGLTGLPHREFSDDSGWSLYRRGYFQAKGGTCYSFRQYPKYDKQSRQNIMDYKDTQIANYVIQGEASFIVQAACGLVIRELMQRNFADGLVLPINTVHDALYLDCATEALAQEYGTLVQKIMQDTPKIMCQKIPAYLDWRYDSTPFPAAGELGISMMEKTHID